MEPINRNRFNWLAIGITALVLLNIGLVATIWLQRPTVAAISEAAPPAGARNLLVQDLGFDSSQALRFDSLRRAHQQLMQEQRREMRALKDDYFDGLRHDSPPSDSLAVAIGALQARIDRGTYEHFRQVRALCTDEQKERFDRLLTRIIRHMGTPRPRPEGPPPGEGPGGPPMGDGPLDGPPPPGPEN